ncbi:MAG: ZIP family metal transporter [Pararhodobacter sp.]
MFSLSVLTVFLAALLTALATGLGALPLLAIRRVTPRLRAIGTAIAAGLMLAASFSLITEGFAVNAPRTLIGIVAGLGLIWLARQALPASPPAELLATPTDADARLRLSRAHARSRIMLIMVVMTAHSAAEGVGVGVAWGGGEQLGGFITLAIALHNIPEGLAIALIMVPRGASVAKAAVFAIASSLPQPLLAVPAFVFVTAFSPWLPVGLGLAAGAMLWMIFSELLPDAQDGISPGLLGVLVTAAFTAMLGATLTLG